MKSKEKQPFAKQAAKASWAVPLLTLVMMSIGNSAAAPASKLGIAILSVILLVVGIILAIISFIGIRQHGRQGILVPGIIGFLLNGIILVLLSAIALSAYNKSATWQTVNSAEGHFSIMMPVAPKEQINKINSEIGPLEMHLFLSQNGAAVFLLSYTDYPENIIQQNSPEAILNSVRDGAIANTKGSLLNESNLQLLNKYEGREINVDIPNTAELSKSRIFLVNNRVYQLVVSSEKKKADLINKETSQFLNSFTLLQ